MYFEQSLENSNIWTEARCKEVIPSRAVDNITTKGENLLMELSSCCCLLSFLHRCKSCLHFSNADSDGLITINWMSINKQNTNCPCSPSEVNKQYKTLLLLVTSSLYEVKIFILCMANSHPQNWEDKYDVSNIKKYVMVSIFIVQEKSYQNQPLKHEISRICHSLLQTVSQLLQRGIKISNLFVQPCLYSILRNQTDLPDNCSEENYSQ